MEQILDEVRETAIVHKLDVEEGSDYARNDGRKVKQHAESAVTEDFLVDDVRNQKPNEEQQHLNPESNEGVAEG